MTTSTLVSPEEQSVTFVELFFDLVFVFSVTQTVGLLHDGLTWTAVGQMVLVFWLVWWAWSQFTWALNAADTTHPLVEVGALAATAVAFFMAVALPDAFHGRALWFAGAYVLVRAIGITLYSRVAAADPEQRAAVRVFSVISIGGLVAVLIGGALGGPWQIVFWGLTIVLDIVAAAVGGQQSGWNLHPEHFGERHGLFVIIALGESLIVAAGGVTGAIWNGDLVAVAVLAVALTCALWWSYFTWAKPALDATLAARRDTARATLARDAYSLLHFPMLVGIIAYAVALEEAIAHPDAPLSLATRSALAVGLLLFVGGLGLALRRATGHWPVARHAIIALTALVVLAWGGASPALSLALGLAGVVLVAVAETRAQVVAAGAA